MRPTLRRRACTAAVALCAAAGCDLPLSSPQEDLAAALEARKGRIVNVTETVPALPEGHRLLDLRITSSSGLEVDARLRLPLDATAGDGRTGVVLIGGWDTGRRAVRLLPDGIDELVIAPDYPMRPEDGDERSDLGRRYDELRDRAWDVPAVVLLLTDYLATRPEVDRDRLALVGASLGGFFSPIAAAADPRLRNVALLYTGGDLRAIVDANLDADDAPAAARRFGTELALLPLQRLEPVRHVGRIAPRHVLIVNGMDDDRIPRGSAERLMDAARSPKDALWLPTGHLDPDSTRLIGELVDTAFSRLPLLRGDS